MSDPIIRWGLLGWSNKRSGLEFYRWDEKTIPRHGTEWGDLLVQKADFPDAEGSPVLVVVLPRNATRDDLLDASGKIRDALAGEQETTA